MIRSLILITLILFSGLSFSEQAASGTDGIDGCDGGTNPAPDGKFYKPDGKPCNPSDEDAKKVNRNR